MPNLKGEHLLGFYGMYLYTKKFMAILKFQFACKLHWFTISPERKLIWKLKVGFTLGFLLLVRLLELFQIMSNLKI